ncbi:YrdB family protein [Vagococcus fluvialis]|uniref:YrdB family protein n=1 Tax=Vagococcus fluvialis TaxID=2738 RepID=UPI003B220D5D
MLKLNDAIAFVLEIVSIILLTRWAYSIPNVMWQKIFVSVLSLIIFVFVWSNYFAPTSPKAIRGTIRWGLEFLIFFFPYLQFKNSNFKYIIIGGIMIVINLFFQANFGRAEW